MSSDDQFGIDQSPSLPPSSVPDKEMPIERIINRGLRTYLVVDHTANQRKNSKISAIWHHGGERSIYGTKATDEEDDPLGPDEFQRFISATPTTIAKNGTHWNPINWWIEESQKCNYDTLHLYALDHLSFPAMATQCERVFSAARRTLTPARNALGLKVLEACDGGGGIEWSQGG